MIAWHYTTGAKLELILNSGVLRPADIGVEPPEKPILWFSLHPYYENSARKGLRDDSGRVTRAATVAEMYEMGGGLFRFGCPINQLKHGEVLRKAAKMQSIVWRKLLKGAVAMGASAGDWWGHIGEVPIADLVFEAMDDKLKWRPFEELFDVTHDEAELVSSEGIA